MQRLERTIGNFLSSYARSRLPALGASGGANLSVLDAHQLPTAIAVIGGRLAADMTALRFGLLLGLPSEDPAQSAHLSPSL